MSHWGLPEHHASDVTSALSRLPSPFPAAQQMPSAAREIFARETGVLETAAWVPPLFGFACIVIGMGHVIGDDIRRNTPLQIDSSTGGAAEVVDAPPPVRLRLRGQTGALHLRARRASGESPKGVWGWLTPAPGSALAAAGRVRALVGPRHRRHLVLLPAVLPLWCARRPGPRRSRSCEPVAVVLACVTPLRLSHKVQACCTPALRP